MNQLKDITLDARYATVCGYTQQDLVQQQAGKQVHQLGLVFNNHARNLVQMDWLTAEKP